MADYHEVDKKDLSPINPTNTSILLFHNYQLINYFYICNANNNLSDFKYALELSF